MKRYYFSDVHMGKFMKTNAAGAPYKNNYVWLDRYSDKKDKTALKKRLKGFLDYLAGSDANEVVMVGDILDNWICPVDVLPPSFDDILGDPANASVVKSLRQLCAKKEVVYLPGNHDMGINSDKHAMAANLKKTLNDGNHEYGLQYVTGNLTAEHGTSSAMFNGPDYVHDKQSYLPLGYFISRMVATNSACTGAEMDIPKVIAGAVRMFRKGGMTDGVKFIKGVVKTVCSTTGLDMDTGIMIPPNPFLDPDAKGYITVQQVAEMYKDLYTKWDKTGPHLLDSLGAMSADASNVSLMVAPLNKQNDTNIVILGHTHDALHGYYRNSKKYVYANCGCWCNAPSPGHPNNGHFVTTEDEGGNTTVRLWYWDDKNKKPVQSGDPVVYPKPIGPM